MPEDGNHICLDATPGSEKIEIVDQHKNKIVLDASKEIIKLEAPTNSSKIVLGKAEAGNGVYIKTAADYYLSAANKYEKDIRGHNVTTVQGGYTTLVGGFYTTTVGGFYTTAVGGAYTAIAGGVYTSLALGLKFESCVGAKLEANYCHKYNLTNDTDYRKATNIADTAKKVWSATADSIVLEGDVGLHAKGQCISLNDGIMKIKK
ncbi:MAG: hypothetical protein MUC83_01235 [Pirellula sp.]|jgi:hypothetical protein|nr:hypothetical protein [Pirellula sp.]